MVPNIVALSLCFALLSVCAFPRATQAKGEIHQAAKHHVLADDGSLDASFALLRKQVLEAIEKHDKSFIEGILAEDIATSIGGGSGKKNFNEQWQDLSADNPFWERLKRVLLHGAQFDKESDEYHAPSVAFDDSHSELPQAVVWTSNAELHKSADDAEVINNTLYGQQITIIEPAEHKPVTSKWVRITSQNGAKGFMKAADVYSAFDDFAVFKKSAGKWTLSWFGFAEL